MFIYIYMHIYMHKYVCNKSSNREAIHLREGGVGGFLERVGGSD